MDLNPKRGFCLTSAPHIGQKFNGTCFGISVLAWHSGQFQFILSSIYGTGGEDVSVLALQ